jgi:cytochrome oxidase Cu insertion factor (SCO1/SenC/PrrC family)
MSARHAPVCRLAPALLSALFWTVPVPSLAASASVLFSEEANLVGHSIPDAELQLSDGSVTRLSTLWHDQPLLLTLFYRRCTGTCQPLLFSMRDWVERLGGLGHDYHILALSFADSDIAEDMKAQADALGLEHDPNWIFAVARPGDMQRIADALGFWFHLDQATGQYDHPTLLAAVDHGRVLRGLFGYPISPERFRELVWELRGRFVPYYELPAQRSWLRCFEYDPRSGTTRFDWGMLLLLAPGTMGIASAAVVFTRSRKAPGGA